VRGLKLLGYDDGGNYARRTPHGVRGLKCHTPTLTSRMLFVAPLTGCVD